MTWRALFCREHSLIQRAWQLEKEHESALQANDELARANVPLVQVNASQLDDKTGPAPEGVGEVLSRPTAG